MEMFSWISPPLHFSFTQIDSLDFFFYLPAMHSKENTDFKRQSFPLKFCRLRCWRTKNLPSWLYSVIVIGTVMSKNNTNQRTFTGSTHVRYEDTLSHSYINTSSCFYACLKMDFISYSESLGWLWSSLGCGRSYSGCSIKSTTSDWDETTFKEKFSVQMSNKSIHHTLQ